MSQNEQLELQDFRKILEAAGFEPRTLGHKRTPVRQANMNLLEKLNSCYAKNNYRDRLTGVKLTTKRKGLIDLMLYRGN